MSKVQANACTRDGHTFHGEVLDHTIEEAEKIMDYLDDNWADAGMLRIYTEEGFTSIPLDNLSYLSFSVVDEG